MSISLIAAMTERGVIGNAGGMPWHIPADLRWFKELTLGKPIIMGHTTWRSLGRALPHRRNIVLSRDSTVCLAGAEVVSSARQALDLTASADEVMIIGGGHIYQQFLPLAQRLYLTKIKANYTGDTYFPDYNCADWELSLQIDCRAQADTPACSFQILNLIP